MGLGTLSILAGVASMVLLYLPAAAPFFRKYQPFAGAPTRNRATPTAAERW